MPPCLTLSIIRYESRVKWSNPGKWVAPSPTLQCISYWKRDPSGHPRLQSPTLLRIMCEYFFYFKTSIAWNLVCLMVLFFKSEYRILAFITSVIFFLSFLLFLPLVSVTLLFLFVDGGVVFWMIILRIINCLKHSLGVSSWCNG